MSIKPAKVQFNGGELSPWLEGRTDLAKYNQTAKLCRNFIPLAEGCLKRRGGTRFAAMTEECDDVKLVINAVPSSATIFINGVNTNEIVVERGDTVEFEVTCSGYRSYQGSAVVVDNAEITVVLTSLSTTCLLEIETEPADALVMIEGVERRYYNALQNSSVYYRVSKDEYNLVEDTVLMNCDKKLHIVLEETLETGVYGDWGEPQYFVSCAAVGCIEKQLKSFCIRFDNGYLFIIFSATLNAPGSTYETYFYYTTQDGYNAVCVQNNKYCIAKLQVTNDAFRYNDINGKLLLGVDLALSAKVFGWQVDENGSYASFYTRYDGEIHGNIIRVKYDNSEVWKLKRRTV